MKKTKYYEKYKHIYNLITSSYYKNLIDVRNSVGIACDNYFQKLNVPRVDLFLISQGVSSPMGKGSDSLPIEIEFNKQHAYLADSSQFGMEPLVQENFRMVYCYLPSFRGEESDDRHLNQFFHCEAELRGDYIETMKIAEGLVKEIIREILKKHSKLGLNKLNQNIETLQEVISNNFPRVTLDEVEKIFKDHNLSHLVERKSYGRVLTNEAELKIGEIIGDGKFPVWVTNHDRDTVPFYQKPDPTNPERVLNADLIFPSLDGGFGGEIIGLGQRQDKVNEIEDSITRQGIKNTENYNWYINLRNNKEYKVTSGFGLGIERLIAWFIGVKSIVDTSIYPVIKGGQII